MKRKTQTLATIASAAVLASSAAFAQEPECTTNIYLAEKSEYRANAGFSIVETPITELSSSLSCGKVDAYIWGAYNNHAKTFNEVDFGIGYTLSKDDLSVRFGLDRWQYTEFGGKNDVASVQINYSGLPVDLSVKVTEFLDAKGTQAVGTISKTFDVGSIADTSVSVTPYFKAAHLDSFFGSTGHTADVFGVSLNATKDNAGYNVFIDKHDGHHGFSDTTVIGASFSYAF